MGAKSSATACLNFWVAVMVVHVAAWAPWCSAGAAYAQQVPHHDACAALDYRCSALPIEQRAEDLLSKMTNEELLLDRRARLGWRSTSHRIDSLILYVYVLIIETTVSLV